jgi:putative ABC transport system permease protein
MLAGSYPALFFASARPADVLRGELPGGLGTTGLRKGLVTFQFVAAIALIAVTAIMAQQLRFVQQKDLGFETDQIVIVRVADRQLAQHPERLRAEFGRLASARAVTAGFGVPTQGYFPGRRFIHRPNGEDGPSITFVMPAIDEHFLETFEIPLLAGRNISSTIDTSGTVEGLINEQGLQAIGWSDPTEALGETIGRATVVGVVPNFHFESLHAPIEPLIMQQNPSGQAGQVALRVGGSNVEDVLADIRRTWARLDSEQPLETTFLSDHLRELYAQERTSAQVFGLFAGLAILIACLGLFGLATFAAERRTQEIGIRKALGASMGRLAWLLMQDTGRLAMLGLVLAAPLAYWAGQRWLQDFAYRIDIGPGPLLAAGAVALAVAAVATGTQAVRAARTNPADALRYE